MLGSLLTASLAAVVAASATPSRPVHVQQAALPSGLIAFARHGDIYVVDVRRRRVRAITRNAFKEGRPSWSPNGRRLAFTRSSVAPPADCKGCAQNLFGMRADGTGVTKLSRIPKNGVFDDHPTWAPDGRRLAFERSSYTWEAIY
jgi:Tol biopolymer transport system component